MELPSARLGFVGTAQHGDVARSRGVWRSALSVPMSPGHAHKSEQPEQPVLGADRDEALRGSKAGLWSHHETATSTAHGMTALVRQATASHRSR